jgi:hypothetical protein
VLGLVFFFELLLGYEVPEPVAGSVLEPLRVPVWLPMVEPVIELSLPLPPVLEPLGYAPLPVVEDWPLP